MSAEEFEKGIKENAGDKTAEFLTLLNSQNFPEFVSRLPKNAEEQEGIKEIKTLLEYLEDLGITNAVFSQTLMRGFDYYTGIVFEVFDKNPENRRSVFGGGRYDDLLAIFGEEKAPAVGFGAGDVIIRDIMESYKLLPIYTPPAKLCICLTDEKYSADANELAQKLREQNVNVSIDYSERKLGDQIKSADKKKIPFILCLGENEIKSGKYKVKNLSTGNETELTVDEIAKFIFTK
jgi:histidyl-tRNA synthetase